ncbi:MAG TPA: hypothetical protein VES01_02520 [Dermatophilaceae bacterium]|nr:hypothetical protein [Dermatophilaceae bacterium]
MELSRSHSITLTDLVVDAAEVGGPDFYLGRWGFLPGGIGVAAVWAGGCARVADVVEAAVPSPRRSSAQLVRWGRVRTDLAVAAALCRAAPAALEGADAHQASIVATEVRAGVAAAARRLLDEARSVAGPAGLAFVEDVIRAVDDLSLYIAQQNADADAGRLGGMP